MSIWHKVGIRLENSTVITNNNIMQLIIRKWCMVAYVYDLKVNFQNCFNDIVFELFRAYCEIYLRRCMDYVI